MADKEENYVYSYSPSKIPLFLWVGMMVILFTLFFFAIYSLSLRT